MNTKSKTFLLVLLSAFVLAGFFFVRMKNTRSAANNAVGGLQKITIAQWGQQKYLIYLPVYLAQEKGLFAKHGLEVSLVFSGNDDQVFATVARGDAQFGVGDPIFTAISRKRGFDGIVVASIVDRVALWGVSKTNRVLYRAPGDFAKTRVGTFPRPSTTYTLVRQMLDENKISDGSVVEVPIGNEMALLEAEKADVVMMLEPAASVAESRGYYVVTSFPQLWGPFAFTGLTASESWVNKNPGVVNAIRSALAEAVNIAHQNEPEAIAVAEKLFPTLEKAVVRSAVTRMIRDATLPRDVNITTNAWLNAVHVRQAMGELDSGKTYLECLKRE